ncbi:protein PAT1 homolog 2 isoform X2 [Amia ocellicauda]|uniref:protein PAT1 homolog 2 isoform X2 n=1 Tax=Amia ocellicauda TaxID=2972642 RepID=UPI0034649C17
MSDMCSPAPLSLWPEEASPEEDEEEGTALLQQMAEEDEEIDLYNEETFGLDLESGGEEEDPTDLLLFCGDLDTSVPSLPPQPPPQTPPPPPRPPTMARPAVILQRQPSAGLRWLRQGRRDGGRRVVFEDPAVVRTVEGRPSLQSLDSAIVDSGVSSSWEDDETSEAALRLLSPYGSRAPASILQDKAIVSVIDRPNHPRIPPTTLNFLSPMSGRFSAYSPGAKRVPPGHLSPRALGQRYLSQSRGFPSPSSPNIRTPPRPFNPKMMLRFGALSPGPGPAPFFSPPAKPPQRFRIPGHVTQLHPQHRRILSQRQQRSQRRATDSRWDPYSHIMTLKEKEWVIRLQMIQLQSENPHLDDYYYQVSKWCGDAPPPPHVHCSPSVQCTGRVQGGPCCPRTVRLGALCQEYYQRLENKLAEEELLGDRGKREPPKLTTPYVTKTDSYQPVVHIEGSLGQVAVSTCFSPRRAIDAVHAHTHEEELKDTRQQRLSILHDIEKMYMVMLELEEGQRKASLLPEDERLRLREQRERRVHRIYTQLRQPGAHELSEEFLPYLLVAKGKRLVSRLLPYLSHDSALQVLRAVTTHLPVLMARDSTGPDEVRAHSRPVGCSRSVGALVRTNLLSQSLPVLYPSLCQVIGGLSFTQLIRVLKEFTAALPDSKETRLYLACKNKFGISLLYALLSQGERLLSSDTPMEPSIGDFESWTDIVFQVARQLSQCSLVEPLLLPSNLLSLFCRYLDKQTVHQLEESVERSTAGCPAIPS